MKKRRKKTEEKIEKRKERKTEYRETKLIKLKMFGFTIYIKNHILFENIVWKKQFIPLFTVFMRYRVSEKVIIHHS